ncbi:hypothetical protein BDK62_12438 [Halomonas alkaliantarctica]|nr:hypothetical protein BDK62_12438 [Halomonas alkaliantarctica]
MNHQSRSCAVPSIDDAINMLDSYAALLSLAIERTDVSAEAVTYLPTWRAVRCCLRGFDALQLASSGMSYAQSFTHPVVLNGRWFRPVDLLRQALEQLEDAARAVQRHQYSEETPSASRAALAGLADRVFHVEQDLRGLIGPAVAQLSFPHRQQA